MLNEMISPEALQAFLSVVAIDLVLAGDNAVVIGLAAAGLPAELRKKAIFIGIVAATLMRIAFALVASQLLALIGLLFAGGVLLLWVAWKMWRELREGSHQSEAEMLANQDLNKDGSLAGQPPNKTLRQAVVQILVADVSMSLDNVLAVAGAAREHPMILIFGLGLSIMLMAVAATYIARLLHNYRWIAYFGLVMILYVALQMMWEGGLQICNQGLPLAGIDVPRTCELAHGGEGGH